VTTKDAWFLIKWSRAETHVGDRRVGRLALTGSFWIRECDAGQVAVRILGRGLGLDLG
jgi:hypothetical protein